MSELTGGTTRIQTAPPSAEELAILRNQAALLGINLQANQAALPLQQALIGSALPAIGAEQRRTELLDQLLQGTTPSGGTLEQDLIRRQLGLQQGLLGFQEQQLGSAGLLQAGATTSALGQLGLQQSQLREFLDETDLTRGITEFQRSQLEQAQGQLPASNELVQLQLDQLRRGISATPQQNRLISRVANQAIAAGTTDIDRFRDEALEQLRQEFSPAAGLRPSDTPVLDRASRVQAEALRQFGQLAAGVRQGAAQARLNFPLQASQVLSAQNIAQQGALQNQQQFQSLIQQNAQANRLAALQGTPQTAAIPFGFQAPSTAGTVGLATQGGLGLAGMSPSIPSFPRNQTQTTTSVPNLLSGLGGLGLGLAGVIDAFR